MTKHFGGRSHYVWIDSETLQEPRLSLGPTDAANPRDEACRVSVGLWMGLIAAKELHTLLGQAIAELESAPARGEGKDNE